MENKKHCPECLSVGERTATGEEVDAAIPDDNRALVDHIRSEVARLDDDGVKNLYAVLVRFGIIKE